MKFAMKLGVVLLAVTLAPSILIMAQSGTTTAMLVERSQQANAKHVDSLLPRLQSECA